MIRKCSSLLCAVLLLPSWAVAADKPSRSHEEVLHIAIREIPAVLALPSPDRPDDPNARFAQACSLLESRFSLPPSSLVKELPGFAQKLLDDRDTPVLERAGALFVVRKYAEAEAAATRLAEAGSDAAKAWQLAGRSAAQQGQLDRAMKYFRTAASLVSQQQEPLEWAGMQRNIAIVLIATGQLHDAEIVWREILDVHLQHLKPQHPDVLGARNVLAGTLVREGKFAEAAAQYREVVAVLEKARGADHPDMVRARQSLERALRLQGSSKPGSK